LGDGIMSKEKSQRKIMYDAIIENIENESKLQPFVMVPTLYWACEIDLNKEQTKMIHDFFNDLDERDQTYYKLEGIYKDFLIKIAKGMFFKDVIDGEKLKESYEKGKSHLRPKIRLPNGLEKWFIEKDRLASFRENERWKVHLIYW
jgi:hypothetical protein